ncbi:MAG: hypothetical protein QG618_450 [Thermodesulfobacteriota bacterium]|nr:hypothetical protein [Thermodesulfobacteriota bacterium]
MRFSWIYDGLNLPMGGEFKRFLLFFRVLVFIGCTGGIVNGCTGGIVNGRSIIPVCTIVCRDAMVKQGQDAYLNEEYALARQIFSQLALRKDDVPLQAVGLYGNACLDMILADNAPTFRTAVEKLLRLPSQLPYRILTDGSQEPDDGETRCNTWCRIPPDMIEKALDHGMILLESERSGMLENLNALYSREEVYKKERLSMQKKIDSRGLKITVLKKQNRHQEARIRDLLHQINVLEKIDKERQEQRGNQ